MGTGYSFFSDEDDIRRELKKINEKLDDIRDLTQQVEEIKELLREIATTVRETRHDN